MYIYVYLWVLYGYSMIALDNPIDISMYYYRYT